MFEQPIDSLFREAKVVLLAGCGGGYDVLGAVPLYDALIRRGCQVHLASLSFTYLNGLDGAVQDSRFPNMTAIIEAVRRDIDVRTRTEIPI